MTDREIPTLTDDDREAIAGEIRALAMALGKHVPSTWPKYIPAAAMVYAAIAAAPTPVLLEEWEFDGDGNARRIDEGLK